MTSQNSCCVIAIDPGNTDSAVVFWSPEAKRILAKAYVPNKEVFGVLRSYMGQDVVQLDPVLHPRLVAIEQIRSYGQAVGATIFDTVHWSGRFHQFILDHWHNDDQVILVPRQHVKMHLCHTNKAKDTNVNTAVADRFGGVKTAKGTKKDPGPLYGVAGDIWAALALAITVGDNMKDGKYVPGSCGTFL